MKTWEKVFGGITALAAVLAIVVFGALGFEQWQAEEEAKLAEQREAARLAQIEHDRIEALWRDRFSRAQRLAQNASLQDEHIHCQTPNYMRPKRSSGDADTDHLMAVSEAARVIFFVPGLELHTEDGWHTFDQVNRQFASEISILDRPYTVVCLVRWPTTHGFGPDDTHLSDAIYAVSALSEDPIIKPKGAPRLHLMVMGYSAGGNYAEYSLSQAFKEAPHFAVPEVRLITVATPHNGSQLIDMLQSPFAGLIHEIGKGAANWIRGSAMGDELDKANEDTEIVLDKYPTHRGLQQLASGNPDVAALHQALETLKSRIFYSHYNIYSYDDKVVLSSSAYWPGAIQANIPYRVHERFLDIDTGNIFYTPAPQPLLYVLKKILSDDPPSQEVINAILSPPPPETAPSSQAAELSSP